MANPIQTVASFGAQTKPNMSTPTGPKTGGAGLPFVIAGLKPVQPGGLGTQQTNTLPTKQVAPQKDQQAVGNATNTPPQSQSFRQPDGSSTLMAPSQLPTPTTQTTAPTYATTPNGAKIDTATGAIIAPAPTQTPTFGGTVGTLINTAQQTPQSVTNAQEAIQQAGKNIQTIREQAAQGQGGTLTSGMLSPVAQGRAAVIGQTAGALEQAQLANVAQQNAAAGIGQAQQNIAISGLGNAAGQIKPTSNFPFVFDPASGTFSAPGVSGTSQPSGGFALTYDPARDSQTLADKVINHQISYADAVRALGYGGNSVNADGQLSAAILAKGGNPSILQTQAGIQNTQEEQYQAYNSAHQQAQNLQSQLTDLITTFGLNPNDLNAANKGIQFIASQSSDPRYKILSNYLADVASRYSQILTPPGGSATDTTRSVAAGMLDGLASGKSIIDVMNSLDQQAQAVSAGVKTIGNTSGTSGGISVQAKDGNSYSFVQDANGNWVAK